ncbi:MAG: glycosyltransferase family 4 protein [Microbacterium sp.]
MTDGRAGARLSAFTLGVVAAASGLLPPRVRYGYVHRITRALLQKPQPAVHTPDTDPTSKPTSTSATVTPSSDLVCVLAAGALDVGGIGSVVELLADQLPTAGITPAIVCFGDGARAQRIRDRGLVVLSVSDRASALRAFDELRPDVIQLHGAPGFVESAAQASGAPLVPVMHNTEIHYSTDRWRGLARLLDQATTGIAVSDVVHTFHAAHLPTPLQSRIVVIPNAAPGRSLPSRQQRRFARGLVERAVGSAFHDDVVFACLARYDAQKNVAGTVASFLNCVSAGVPAQLVIAGEPTDWVEFRRSDAIRRSSPSADRVHLLATSDARTLFAAADAFLLNSFFEGWPVAATEAWTAGLPLILSDVGGARELVARDPARSALISNASGDASAVSDRRVERARWRASHQSNSSELGDAVLSVVGTVHRERVTQHVPRVVDDGVAAMIEAHARALHGAALNKPSGGSTQRGRLSGDGARKVASS